MTCVKGKSVVDSVNMENIGFEKRFDYDINDFIRLMSFLCSPDGCPWDREQTHQSIKRNLLEEAYETAEAIDNYDTTGIIEELGDVLMQVLFHADIAKRAGTFNIDAIADTACKKLISRHPHVFGDVRAKDTSEALNFWENQKREEKFHSKTFEAMQSVAKNLPQLWQAEKIQKKAAMVGFDWESYEGALDTLKSEIGELEQAILDLGLDSQTDDIRTADGFSAVNEGEVCTENRSAVKEEIGDLLFSIVNVARFFDVDPEEALKATNAKFISRFAKLETVILAKGEKLDDKTFDELELIYQKVKLEK